jgi:hypothetical protein
VKDAPYCGPIVTGLHRAKFNRPGDLSPGICSHLSLIHVRFVGHGHRNHHNGNKVYLFPRGIFYLFGLFILYSLKKVVILEV